MKSLTAICVAALGCAVAPLALAQQTPATEAEKTLSAIIVEGGAASALPALPATTEGVSGEQVQDTINAIDSEDALKYLPSINVRKRFAGDYDHAVLASRASGTGNSARSLVYADGILLSNLLGNGAAFTPRWALVTPEEIERVDVLYGPYSAAYSGNSVGAIVAYVTRMPTSFEAHGQVARFTQPFQLYRTDATYSGHQESVSLGNRHGPWSWWINLNRLDNDGQPLSYANRLVTATGGVGGTPVSGAVSGNDPRNRPWLLLGSTSQTHTEQEHAKAKLALDLTPTLRASYTLGWWQNQATRASDSFLRDAAGNPVYSGTVNINGLNYALTPADFAPSRARLEHVMHGLSLKSTTKGVWDWEIAGSLYDYANDQVRSPTVALPAAATGGAGTVTDMQGTGWSNLALKGTWRPDGMQGAHSVDVGYQLDSFRLRTLVSSAANWTGGDAGARVSAFNGNTRLQSLYAQDTWRFAPRWRSTVGGRLEQWTAYGGEIANASTVLPFGERRETHFSPKAGIAFQATPVWNFKASLGRAVRMPTVSELYQGTIAGTAIQNNDPNLKPEKAWSGELSVERAIGSSGLLRATLFHEDMRDALISQTNVSVTPNVTSIQNVAHIRTTGVELAWQQANLFLRGLELAASLTYADSTVLSNPNFPASEGKAQPRVPKLRATVLASWHVDEHWTGTLGARYSGRQYGQLDNSDTNGYAYTGFSEYFVVDARVRYRFDKHWTGSLGVDNLTNYKYWAFHPYPQRSFVAELRYKF